jgi:hypothetical protein
MKFIIPILICGLFALSACTLTGGVVATPEFAQCITDAGATMYGAFWCSHCESQKDMFGDSVDIINYVECSTPDGKEQTNECALEGISGYPTWKFADGITVEGALPLSKIGEITSCN